MKRAVATQLAPLMEALRAHPVLREVREAHFHLHGREFLHFHDEPDGVVADVRLATGRVRLPAASRSDQAELLERVDRTLEALESRERGRRRSERRRRPRNDGGSR